MSSEIDKYRGYTLFLDRDGVINRRIPGGYVGSPAELEILPGALEAIQFFSHYFQRIIIVSNQQGVGKGLITLHDVERVHDYLVEKVKQSGGRVDGVYFCPSLASENDQCRKPSSGMALQAQKDFPDIVFHKTVMAGDSISDLQFAGKLNMVSVFIETEPNRAVIPQEMYGCKFPSLLAFARSLGYQH